MLEVEMVVCEEEQLAGFYFEGLDEVGYKLKPGMRLGSAPVLDRSRRSCSSVFYFLFLMKGIFGAIATRRMREGNISSCVCGRGHFGRFL
jgi:hypothetical protein